MRTFFPLKAGDERRRNYMGWICPECGFTNVEDAALCTCGFDRSVFISSDPAEAESADEERLGVDPFGDSFSVPDIPSASPSSSVKRAIAEKPRARRSSFHPSDRVTLKEVGTWKFSFSPSEGKISIGTAALDPFRLHLAVEDLEEILESVYEMTGTEKTLRGLKLPDMAVLEIVEFVSEMIDAKRSKIKPPFSPEDVTAIAALINGKLSS
ncbi:MAG: hypothetical protein P8013_03495 [Candidatus Sulfobium sp.]